MGSDVLVAANCTFVPINHAVPDLNRAIRLKGFLESRGGILIEDDVCIGANRVILDGAIIRQGCVVAAASVVRRELDAYTVYGGNPLKMIRRRS